MGEVKRAISIIGVPIHLGQTYRGVDLGPSAIRHAGMVERLEAMKKTIYDVGNIEIQLPKREKCLENEDEKLRNLSEVAKVNERLAKTVSQQILLSRFPLVLGGDHSIAIGTIASMSEHYQSLGVIWFDAHGDINTDQTTPSGNIHGMPLAASLGLGDERLTSIVTDTPKIKRENIVLLGVRDLDDGEKKRLRDLSIKVYTMHDIDRLGVPYVIKETIRYLKDKTDGIHVSFDIDSVDPSEAPGVGTPVAGGLTYRESRLALEMLSETGLITSAEFVEVNPLLDERNKTAKLVVALASALLGEKFN